MLLGCIADDFTGASDIANTLAKGGMKTVQFMGVPQDAAPADCEAGIVSLKSRSIPVADAVSQSLKALAWLKAQGCEQIVFKYCSTFDSTREGNIGPVAEALAKELGARAVVVCPAFPDTGRTIYQGHLFVKDRLLSESGLENHPVTPMTDPDIRRWLSYQATSNVGHVPISTVSQGPKAVAEALSQHGQNGTVLVVVDAISNDHLRDIGAACADAALITGGSGIALGLPANFAKRGQIKAQPARFPGLNGPGVILSGSCSSATLGQIAYHVERYPHRLVDLDELMAGKLDQETFLSFAAEHANQCPLIASSASPAEVKAAQQRYGQAPLSERLDHFFGSIARALVERGLERLVVAGGETSGAVVSALHLGHVAIGPEIDPGVPILTTSLGKPLALALKSGNFGGPDFFERALSWMGRSE